MRFRIAKERLSNIDSDLQQPLDRAETLQESGNWIHAGEQFFDIARKMKERRKGSYDTVRVFAKAASCFECANQFKDAGMAYSAAAGEAHHNREIDRQILAELYSRAGHCYSNSEQFFSAGTSFRSAAEAFELVVTPTISIDDAIPPLPMAAGKYTMAGRCFDASSEVYARAGEFGWACGSSWLAGKAQLRETIIPHISYGTCESFKQSLMLFVRAYKSLRIETLRTGLPLSDEERTAQLNPAAFVIDVVGKHFRSGERDKLQRSTSLRGEQEFKYISTLYQELSLELKRIGNEGEASEYFVRQKQHEQKNAWHRRAYLDWATKFIWRVTCNYGEDLRRWIFVSAFMFAVFTISYSLFDLIEPVNSWIDYPYFSIITLTSLGYGDIHPKGGLGKIVACTEIMCGLIMFGTLVTLFGKRLIKN